MDKDVEKTLLSLKSRHLNGIFAENPRDAMDKILDLIPEGAVVGIGDSTTVRQLGVIDKLKKRGIKVLNPFDRNVVYSDAKDLEERLRLQREAAWCDMFLTGTNAITQDGKLVNVDGVGCRVAGMVCGHPTSIIVVGRNKIVKNIDEAFYRIRNVIAPNHIRIRSVELGGQRYNTPCVATGKCNDCRSIERACNVFMIIEGKPMRTEINVIVVNEDLGLGWDESWPKERIEKIKEDYKKFVWIPPDILKVSRSKAISSSGKRDKRAQQ